MNQWHPIFAQLLRPVVEDYYEVLTSVAVGDLPREADLVLLRRLERSIPPFRGLWRNLTQWNVIELKGPTVSPRRADIPLLVELGLGITRRLLRERVSDNRVRPDANEVSFWYVTNKLGRRFLKAAAEDLGELITVGPGLWRCQVLRHLVFLVSSVELPVEEDSLPLHVIGREPPAVEEQVARLVFDQPLLQARYAGWLASLHPKTWREMEDMAKSKGKGLVVDIRPAVEYLGMKRVLDQVGVDRVIEQVGLKRVIEEVGEKRLIHQIGIDRFLAALSPAERRELKRRLEVGDK